MKADWMTALRKQFGDSFREEVPLAPMTHLRVGGPARGFLAVSETEDLREALKVVRASRIPALILGKGANLLIPDEGFNGLVIQLKGEFNTIQTVKRTKDRVYLRAGAGASLPRLLIDAVKRGLSGLEPLAGIPGTIGGAVVMNAGIPEFTVSDVLSSVTILTPDGNIVKRVRSRLHPTYRRMGLKPGEIVLHATFRLTPSTEPRIRAKMRDYLDKRRNQIWRRFPTAGSVFKNPEGTFAGRLIEACGLKGYRIGDAEVSPEHANVIINRGSATAKDILALIEHIRRVVTEKTGITLETEVVIARS